MTLPSPTTHPPPPAPSSLPHPTTASPSSPSSLAHHTDADALDAWGPSSHATASSASSGAGPSSRPTTTGAHAEFSGSNLPPEEIEMDPIAPTSHRRRRSSLMAPSTDPFSHPRAQSVRNTGGSPQDEPKILEEDADDETSALRPDRRGDDLSDEDLHDDEETGLTSKERRRKRQKRRRNTMLDQRIVREKLTTEERKVADQNVARQVLINCSLIGLWYLFSLSISLYNKWMFDGTRLNFPFPLFTTAVHMLVQFLLASLVLYFIPSLRPHNGHRSDQGQSRHEPEPERPIMSKWFYLTRIGPCGAATGLDIGLGNTSLKYITLTFYTMCKSSSLAFVLLFAFVFRLETPTWRLVGIIATLTLGVVMMVAGEVEFKLGGFLLVISAAFFSGFRWGLTQILLLRNPATSNPFSSIFFLAPVMFVTLLAIAIPSEGFFEMLDGLNTLMGEFGPVLTPMLILFPGTIAFAMTASEFALLQRTSVVTLSIAGIFKEAVTISAAAIVFGDTLTAVNITGLVVTLAAIGAYNWIKISKMRREAQDDVHRGHMDMSEGAPGAFSSSNSTSDADGEDAGEDAGLLRRSNDGEETLFTVDGDLIPKPEGSPGHSDSERRDPHHKASRND